MTDEQLRELYSGALARSGGRARQRCVSPEAMLAVLRREGPEEQRLETLDHVMACAACRGELDLLRSIEQAGAETERAGAETERAGAGTERAGAGRERAGAGTERAAAETERAGVVRRLPRRAWRALVPLALAASVLLAVGIGQRFGRSDAPDEVLRGAADPVSLLAPPPEVAAGAPVTFAWQPVPGARSYRVEVLDAQGTVVFAETTDQTSVTLREPGHLAPGLEYRWGVRATTESGVRASRLRSLRVRKE